MLEGLVTQAANVYINRRKARDDRDVSDRTIRRQAINNFTAATHKHIGTPRDEKAQTAFHAAYTLLELTLPDNLRKLASDFYFATVALVKTEKAPHENVDGVYKDWFDAKEHFLAAARHSYKNLGLPKLA